LISHTEYKFNQITVNSSMLRLISQAIMS